MDSAWRLLDDETPLKEYKAKTRFDEILQRLGWRELALRFLDSFNPKLRTEVIIANAIVDYDGDIPEDIPLRHHAHEFVRICVNIIEHSSLNLRYPANSKLTARGIQDWVVSWNEKMGLDYGKL